MKLVCAKCNLFFRIKKNGVFFEESMPISLLDHRYDEGGSEYARKVMYANAKPLVCAKILENGEQCARSKEEHERWDPYKLWASDKYECRGCGATILFTPASRPIAEHYEAEYSTFRTNCPPTHIVNDC